MTSSRSGRRHQLKTELIPADEAGRRHDLQHRDALSATSAAARDAAGLDYVLRCVSAAALEHARWAESPMFSVVSVAMLVGPFLSCSDCSLASHHSQSVSRVADGGISL